MNRQSLKHGYPVHMAILSHKFEIALQLLSMPDVDAHVLNSVGANTVHLLFVKYDKDAEMALKVLKRCIELGVDCNLVDRMQAAPIHLALGKKQYQSIRDMASLNTAHGRPLFDFNQREKRGLTPLHFALEKQDHAMFLALIGDQWLDVNAADTEKVDRARRSSVIFSAFHKILYQREKIIMAKKFAENSDRKQASVPLYHSVSARKGMMYDLSISATNGKMTNESKPGSFIGGRDPAAGEKFQSVH